MGAGFMGREVFGAFNRRKRLAESGLAGVPGNRDARFLQLGRIAVVVSIGISSWVFVLSFETLLAEIVLVSGETNRESPGYQSVMDWLMKSYTDVE
jgi:hypothetical protein